MSHVLLCLAGSVGTDSCQCTPSLRVRLRLRETQVCQCLLLLPLLNEAPNSVSLLAAQRPHHFNMRSALSEFVASCFLNDYLRCLNKSSGLAR